MATRINGSRPPSKELDDSLDQTAVRPGLTAERLAVMDAEQDGHDPYNSTGRFMVDRLRKLGISE